MYLKPDTINLKQGNDLEYWRLEYAGRAMQGVFSNSRLSAGFIDKHPEKFVKDCIEIADTLIAELQKK